MKSKFIHGRQYLFNVLQILKDKRFEQKAKALAFALTYSILPILLFVNLTLTFLPSEFIKLIENSLAILPDQYQTSTMNFFQSYSIQDTNPILYIALVLFILYTVAVNVRLVIEISNDCYEYSSDRSKLKEMMISTLLFIFIGFGVLSLFAIVIAGQALRTFLQLNDTSSLGAVINQILDMKSLVTILILFMVFFIVYFFAPNVKSTFKSTIVGTLVSTVGLYFASYGFEIYLARSSTYETLYGAVYSQYLLFLFGMYITCQIIIASMIINSLIYERVSIKNYHIEHSKSLINVEFETMHLSLDELKQDIRNEILNEESKAK